jgi:hypothetical protein
MRFVNNVELDRWLNGSLYDADPTPSTGLFTNFGQTTTTITRTGGGSFDLVSMDIDDVYNSGAPSGDLNYSWTLSGGGGGSGTFNVDGVPGYSTLVLNLIGLSSFSFTPSTQLTFVQFDNVVVANVAATPAPAALPLFASALGGLGIFGWKRRRSAVAA